MKKHFRILGSCVKATCAKAMAYRLNFVLTTLITFVGNTLFPLVTLLVYRSGASFPGWSMYEVLLLQAIFTTSLGISTTLFDGVLWATMSYIREGNFEVVFLKPVSPLYYLMVSTCQPDCFGLILGGLLLFVVAVCNVGAIAWTGWLACVALFLAGVAVMAGIGLIMAAISFRWVGNSRIPEIFDSILGLGKYPVSIFPRAVQAFATFLMPVAMVGYYPAAALLGRLNPLIFLAILPCGLFLCFGIWLYNRMIKLYEGVGG